MYIHEYDPMVSVTQMRQELGWSTLQDRRLFNTKVKNNERRTHTHTSTLLYRPGLMCSNTAFFPQTIQCWNILPVTLIEKSSVDPFKNGLFTALQGGSIYLVQTNRVYDRPQLSSNTQLPGAVF